MSNMVCPNCGGSVEPGSLYVRVHSGRGAFSGGLWWEADERAPRKVPITFFG